jgi:hypothetical protein
VLYNFDKLMNVFLPRYTLNITIPSLSRILLTEIYV